MSRRVHGAHHKAPFEGNYCIVSGFWNPILDAGGSDASFFRKLERFVLAKTGEAPSCTQIGLVETPCQKVYSALWQLLFLRIMV